MKLLLVVWMSILVAGSAVPQQKHTTTEWTVAELLRPSQPGVHVEGAPRIIDSPYGKAAYFGGDSDVVFIDRNPVEGCERMTVEAFLQPDSAGPFEQRFLHLGTMQDRVMLETRTTTDRRWYFDAFAKTNAIGCTLVDKTRLHPAGAWHHVAFVIDAGKLTTYVDGVRELVDSVAFVPIRGGQTAIGARQNRVGWFKGAIYKLKITPAVLGPESFMR
jgi:hypothetical protein